MKIILASGSPRRSALLAELGFEFDIHPPNIDETIPNGMHSKKAALYLAQKKGEASKNEFGLSNCILSADSLVILGDKILGKPSDEKEALNMILLLSGKTHEVHTAFHIQYGNYEIAQCVVSEVKMDKISKSEAEYYIENYQPFDKAGSYAIQEWIGFAKVMEIKGSYNNIVGLPTFEVYKALKKIKQAYPG
ncbi:MAG: septum formation protein Maf [Bacteroidetes bacterium]|jgi:septum formation protein|nr:septum formation protein Maf [Bacteroidota bacterium]